MAAALPRTRVIGAYRQLLSAVHAVFGKDHAALSATRAQAKAAFAQHAGERDAARIDRLVAEAADATDFLRTHIVQAALNDSGRYEMKLGAHHAEGGASATSGKIQVQPASTAAQGAAQPGATGGDGACCGGGCR